MPWIIFDDADRRIPAPSFRLTDLSGSRVDSDRYCERENLVLYFVPGIEQAEKLRSFADQIAAYRNLDAVVLSIFPESLETMREASFLRELPLIVLSDPEQKVRSQYSALMVEGLVSPQDHLIFVLDLYGAPYAALISPDLEDPSTHQDILSWLTFIGVQCPE